MISSTSAVIIGLTWGGVQYPWSSPRVLIPVIFGICGIVAFFVYETRAATHPLVRRGQPTQLHKLTRTI
jgi:hypothetical protein